MKTQKQELFKNLTEKVDAQTYQDFCEHVNTGIKNYSLRELKKLAMKYRQTFIFNKLHADKDIQKYVNEITFRI